MADTNTATERPNIIDPLSDLSDTELDAYITELSGGFDPEPEPSTVLDAPLDDLTARTVATMGNSGPMGAAVAEGAKALNSVIPQDTLRSAAIDVALGGAGEEAGFAGGQMLRKALPPHLQAIGAALPFISSGLGAIVGTRASDEIQGRDPMSLEETAIVGAAPSVFRGIAPLAKAPITATTASTGATAQGIGGFANAIGEGLENWAKKLRKSDGKLGQQVKTFAKDKLEGYGGLGRALGADPKLMSLQHEWYKAPEAAQDFASMEKRILNAGFFDNTADFAPSAGLLDDLSQGKLTPERIARKADTVLYGNEAIGLEGLGDTLKRKIKDVSESASVDGVKVSLSETGFNDVLALAQGRKSLYKTARSEKAVMPALVEEIHQIKRSKLAPREAETYNSLNRVMGQVEGELSSLDDKITRLRVREGVKATKQGFSTPTLQAEEQLQKLYNQRASALARREEIGQQLQRIDSIIDERGFTFDEVHDMLKAYSEDADYIKTLSEQRGGARIATEIANKMRGALHDGIKAYDPQAYEEFAKLNRTYGDLRVLSGAAWGADDLLRGQLSERSGLSFGLMPKIVRGSASAIARKPIGTLRSWRVGEMIQGNLERRGLAGGVADFVDNVAPVTDYFAPVGQVMGAGVRVGGQKTIQAGSFVRDIGKQVKNWQLSKEFLPEALRHGIFLDIVRSGYGDDVTDIPADEAAQIWSKAEDISSGIEKDYFDAIRSADYERAAIILGQASTLAPELLEPSVTGARSEYEVNGKRYIADPVERRTYADKIIKDKDIPAIPKAKLLSPLFESGEIVSEVRGHRAPTSRVSGGR